MVQEIFDLGLLLNFLTILIIFLLKALIKTPFFNNIEENINMLLLIFLYVVFCIINVYYDALFLHTAIEFPSNINNLYDQKENLILSKNKVKNILELDLNFLKNLNTKIVNTDTFWSVLDKVYINFVFLVPIYLGFMESFKINLIDQKTLSLFKSIINSFRYTDEIDKDSYIDLKHSLECLKSYIKYKYPIPHDVDVSMLKKYYFKIKTLLIILNKKEEGICLINNLILDKELNLIHIHDCINNLNMNLLNFYY